MNVALVVAPVFDDVTGYSFDWSNEIVDLLKTSYNVFVIAGREIGRTEVEEALKNGVNLYVHYGHGSEDCHWGSRKVKVVDLKNDVLLGGKEVYCMNCLSASKLGRDAVENRGCIAYYGYTDVFVFSTDALNEFKLFANAGLKYRLLGYSWKSTVDFAKEFADVIVEKLYSEGKYIAASALKHDASVLVCWEHGSMQNEKSWLDTVKEYLKRIFKRNKNVCCGV
jgi:hypothetical protein